MIKHEVDSVIGPPLKLILMLLEMPMRRIMPTIRTIIQREAVKTNAFRILDVLNNIFFLNTADHVVCDTVEIRSVEHY